MGCGRSIDTSADMNAQSDIPQGVRDSVLDAMQKHESLQTLLTYYSDIEIRTLFSCLKSQVMDRGLHLFEKGELKKKKILVKNCPTVF